MLYQMYLIIIFHNPKISLCPSPLSQGIKGSKLITPTGEISQLYIQETKISTILFFKKPLGAQCYMTGDFLHYLEML